MVGLLSRRASTDPRTPHRWDPVTGMVVSGATIDSLLREKERHEPSEEFRRRSRVTDDRLYGTAAKDPEGFWAEEARSLHWIRPWERVLEWDPPFAKWFVGGRIHVSGDCLGRHVADPRPNTDAVVSDGEHWEH